MAKTVKNNHFDPIFLVEKKKFSLFVSVSQLVRNSLNFSGGNFMLTIILENMCLKIRDAGFVIQIIFRLV